MGRLQHLSTKLNTMLFMKQDLSTKLSTMLFAKQDLSTKLSTMLFMKQDPAGLGIARIAFGLLMIIDLFEERGFGSIPMRWGDEEECIFPLFDNIPRLSMEGMYMVYLVMVVAAVGITLGLFYRYVSLVLTVKS